MRGSVSDVQDVPNINNVNGGARSLSETLKIGTAEGVSDTEGTASGNGATVGGATPCVESKDCGALTTDGGSGTTGEYVFEADKANSGSDSARAHNADGVNGGHGVNCVNGAVNGGATTEDGIIKEGMLVGVNTPNEHGNVFRVNIPITKAYFVLPSLYHYLNYLYQMLKMVYLSLLSRIG